MARLSASSSTSRANGNISAPSTTPGVPRSSSSLHHEDVNATLRPVAAGSDHTELDWEDAIDTTAVPMDNSLFPGGNRDLSLIGLQAFILGSLFAAGVSGTIVAIILESPWWRLPAWSATLAAFHFLEYYTTARYNTHAVRAESFLLYSNGHQYQIAHGSAALELIFSRLFPGYGNAFTRPSTIAIGLALILVGQGVRSLAMAQAGPSFNHVIARERKDDHKLVTHGFYSVFRHPAYFGFFYWAIGTQLLVGNKICLIGFILVLWNFFKGRITGEEKFLVSFFGDQYIEYREKTGTKIPFIR